MCELTERALHLLWVPATRVRSCLSGTHVEAHVAYNDFEHDKDNSTGFCVMDTGSKGAFLYACTGSHHFVFYLDDVNDRLDQMLIMEKVTVPPNAEVVAHD